MCHFGHVLLHFLARNAHTFTDGVSFASERRLPILLACALRRPSTRFRHGHVQHFRHILRPAFQFRERRKVLSSGNPARRGADGVQKLGDEVPNLFQHAPGRVIEKLLRRAGIGKDRAQHIAAWILTLLHMLFSA